jgi:5-methylcytosine-specific restriction endonuclease McrA
LREKYNNGEWTIGRFNSFVTSILRSGSRRWGPKWQTLDASKTEKRINPATGRLAQFFRCAKCNGEFTAKNVQVDHITPIGYDKSWDEFIDGLFCERENLQTLCSSCHLEKTKLERKNKNKK